MPEYSRARVLLSFVGETALGVAIFVIISAAAVGLDFLVGWMKVRGVSKWIVDGLTMAEFAAFFVDMVLFLVFLIGTLRRGLAHFSPFGSRGQQTRSRSASLF